MNDRIKHRGKPAEPFASYGAYGRITRVNSEVDEKGKPIGPLRITPAARGIPAQAHIEWPHEQLGTFHTWERLIDLLFFKEKVEKE